jgi:hypothetical protein
MNVHGGLSGVSAGGGGGKGRTSRIEEDGSTLNIYENSIMKTTNTI